MTPGVKPYALALVPVIAAMTTLISVGCGSSSPSPSPTTGATATAAGPSPTVAVVTPPPLPTRTPAPASAGTPVPLQDTGWLAPASQTAEAGGDGDGFESDPQAILTQDGLEAADKDSGTTLAVSCFNAGKDRHLLRDFGVSLALPSAIVDGIEVGLQARADSGLGKSYFCLQLSWDGGQHWTDPQRTNQLTETAAFVVAGLPRDPWGRSWTAQELSDANFRVRLIDVSDNAQRDFLVDWVGVRVSYH